MRGKERQIKTLAAQILGLRRLGVNLFLSYWNAASTAAACAGVLNPAACVTLAPPPTRMISLVASSIDELLVVVHPPLSNFVPWSLAFFWTVKQ